MLMYIYIFISLLEKIKLGLYAEIVLREVNSNWIVELFLVCLCKYRPLSCARMSLRHKTRHVEDYGVRSLYVYTI